jgi:hypothetical protein
MPDYLTACLLADVLGARFWWTTVCHATVCIIWGRPQPGMEMVTCGEARIAADALHALRYPCDLPSREMRKLLSRCWDAERNDRLGPGDAALHSRADGRHHRGRGR